MVAFIELRTNDSLVLPKSIPTITQQQLAYLRLPSISETPSAAGKPEIFGPRQNTDKYMDCGRPANRAPQIPPSLYSPIFAEVIDAMDQEPEEDAVQLFTELNYTMRAFYDGEATRNETFRSILNGILAKYGVQFDTGPIRNYSTDGHVKSLLTALPAAGIYFHLCILEGRNEVGQGGAEPFFQDLLYYEDAVNAASSQGLNTNFPVLLLVLAGLSRPLPVLLFLIHWLCCRQFTEALHLCVR